MNGSELLENSILAMCKTKNKLQKLPESFRRSFSNPALKDQCEAPKASRSFTSSSGYSTQSVEGSRLASTLVSSMITAQAYSVADTSYATARASKDPVVDSATPSIAEECSAKGNEKVSVHSVHESVEEKSNVDGEKSAQIKSASAFTVVKQHNAAQIPIKSASTNFLDNAKSAEKWTFDLKFKLPMNFLTAPQPDLEKYDAICLNSGDRSAIPNISSDETEEQTVAEIKLSFAIPIIVITPPTPSGSCSNLFLKTDAKFSEIIDRAIESMNTLEDNNTLGYHQEGLLINCQEDTAQMNLQEDAPMSCTEDDPRNYLKDAPVNLQEDAPSCQDDDTAPANILEDGAAPKQTSMPSIIIIPPTPNNSRASLSDTKITEVMEQEPVRPIHPLDIIWNTRITKFVEQESTSDSQEAILSNVVPPQIQEVSSNVQYSNILTEVENTVRDANWNLRSRSRRQERARKRLRKFKKKVKKIMHRIKKEGVAYMQSMALYGPYGLLFCGYTSVMS